MALHKEYEGQWRGDLKHGKGILYYRNGDQYEGMFADNLRSGHGVLLCRNGDRFEGDWKFDRRNGFGVETKEDTVYSGYWLHGQREGPGHCRFKGDRRSDRLYVAEWVSGSPHCGFFVNLSDVDLDVDAAALSAQKQMLPLLGLRDADAILSAEIKRIRSDRKLVRSLAVINDVEDLFEDHQRDQTLKLKVVDIFEQISVRSLAVIDDVEDLFEDHQRD